MGTSLRESDRAPRFRIIVSGESVYDIADRCRGAVLEFLPGASLGWSRIDLDLWREAPPPSRAAIFPPSEQ